MLITSNDENQIEEWNDGLVEQIEIHLTLTPDVRSRDFRRFYTRFEGLASNVKLMVNEEESGIPFVEMGKSIRFHALAGSGELAPFLEALSFFHNGSAIKKAVKPEAILPTLLRLFITENCPYCPEMVRRIFPLVDKWDHLNIDIIDAMMFDEISREHDVQSVPSLVLDDHFRWNGMVNVDELEKVMTTRDPSRLSDISLERILKEGKAAYLAELMISHGNIFPAFIRLLVHEKWPTRLGAMVVLEEIIEKNNPLAKTVIDVLEDNFDDFSDTVKGDMMYLFGLMATSRALPLIHRVLHDSNHKELRDAAMEALGKIEGTHS